MAPGFCNLSEGNMKKQPFLDPEKQHKLTEQECTLISLFRTLSKPKREAVVKIIFDMLMLLSKGIST
jgi:hypothetical protein